MNDPLKHVEPGSPLRMPASVYNELIDMLRDRRSSRYRSGAGPIRGPVEDSISVLVRNDTGVIIPQFGVLRPTAPVVLPSVSDPTWRERRVYAASAPTATGVFVLTLESIAPEAIGGAIIAGIAKCKLTIADSDHEYAGPTTATDKLTTAAGGPCRIIWKEFATGSGVNAEVLIMGAPTNRTQRVLTCASIRASGS